MPIKFKKDRLPYISLEKDYLLLNDIIDTLFKWGVTLSATGSEDGGYIPLYEFQLGSAFLHFSTLVALMNNPNQYNLQKDSFKFINDIKTKREDVIETKYKWDEVAKGVDTLSLKREVSKEIVGVSIEAKSKIIRLTEDGLLALNTRKYLKKYEEERNKRILYESTLSTNKWMRWFTGVLAFSALTTLITQLPTCKSDKELWLKEKCQHKCQIHKKDSIPTVHDTLFQEYNKGLKGKILHDSTK